MNAKLLFGNGTVKVAISTAASFYIIFHGREIRLSKSLHEPMLYISLVTSFLIALLMVNMIDFTNNWLDERYEWTSEPVKRSLLHFMLCVLLPLTVDFVLMSIYFYQMDTNVFDNGFLRQDFPVIVLFVVIINMYYILRSAFAGYEVTPATVVGETVEIEEDLLSVLCPELQNSGLVLNEDVFYFFRDNRRVILVTTSGKEYPIFYNITDLSNWLFDSGFIRINRSVVINGFHIEGYSDGTRRDTLNLHFTEQCKPALQQKLYDRLLVTKKYISTVAGIFNK